MIKSMTGYGVARLENDRMRVTVEIKSLNSKFLDANVRVPRSLNSREIEIRNLLTNSLVRGKVSLQLDVDFLGEKTPKALVNKELIAVYYQQLLEAAEGLNADTQELFKIATGMPQAIESLSDADDHEEEWQVVKTMVEEAIGKCSAFREQEGATLAGKLAEYIHSIGARLEEVKKFDPERVVTIKERIDAHLREFVNEEVVDKNRFEQELIYYMEKLDIAEEMVRLRTHLDYFLEMLESPDSNGKKLGFISQEIGREINTIGSKANNADIQKLVVEMKEENEKIKEQVLNVL